MTASRFDLVIAGGGLAGASLAAALGSAGLKVAVVDRETSDEQLRESFDGRSSAIARGSQQVLQAIGVWPLAAGEAQPIHDIRVSDGRPAYEAGGGPQTSPFFLHYAESDLNQGPMGFIVENRVLRRALALRLKALPTVTAIAPAEVTAVEAGPLGAEVELSDGRRLAAALVVAAEGKHSRLREAAGIKVLRWRYQQSGVVTTLAHEKPHHGVAHEHFLPAGPFAVLPMTDGRDGGATLHRSSLVWTERTAKVPAVLALDDAAFGAAMERRFGLSLGHLRPLGPRFAYPLELQLAERFHAPRLALLGDAAHVIHPIAGQGFNLGLRDVAALAEAVVDAARLGLDHGSGAVLEQYQRWRRFDTLALAGVTDALNRLFSNDLAPVRLLRDLGLAAVNRTAPLKRLFMRHAMGLVGELPRLVRGQPL